MKQRGKRDRNHGEIRDALRTLGWTVIDTGSVGDGFPDLVACRRGVVRFIEVKDGTLGPSRQRLTQAEQHVHARFLDAGVRVRILTSLDDAEALR